jgi:hypothetical protein
MPFGFLSQAVLPDGVRSAWLGIRDMPIGECALGFGAERLEL